LWVVAKDMALVYQLTSEMGESTPSDEIKRMNHKVNFVEIHENAKRKYLEDVEGRNNGGGKLYCSRIARKKTCVRNLQARYRDMKDKDGKSCSLQCTYWRNTCLVMTLGELL
jgi:hypothetical protein